MTKDPPGHPLGAPVRLEARLGTLKRITKPDPPIIAGNDPPSSEKTCLSVDSTRTRDKHSDLANPFSLSPSHFSLKERGRGRKERSGGWISSDTPPPPAQGIPPLSSDGPTLCLSFSALHSRRKAALGNDDFVLRLH